MKIYSKNINNPKFYEMLDKEDQNIFVELNGIVQINEIKLRYAQSISFDK